MEKQQLTVWCRSFQTFYLNEKDTYCCNDNCAKTGADDVILTCWLFRSELFNFHMFVSFSDFFVLFVFNSILLYLELIFYIISVLLNLWRCILWPSLWSILRMSHVCLRRAYTLLLLGGTFFRCQLEVSRC